MFCLLCVSCLFASSAAKSFCSSCGNKVMISEVYNCDCMEFMRTLPDKTFDLCIADPPYWSSEEQTGRIRTRGNKQSSLDLGSKLNFEMYAEFCRISKAQIIWGANNFGFPFKGFIVWDKTNIPDKFSMSKCELASVSDNLSTVAKMFRAPSSFTGLQRIHPTQKPIALYGWILSTYAIGGGKIFDPMMGSQSSRIAAYKMGYDYWGCEMDKQFFEAGCERFERECLGIEKIENGKTVTQMSLF